MPAGRRARGQRGSVLVLAALMSMILVGFVGLVVDGGEISSAARSSQNAADGAALAAAYDILNNGGSVGYNVSSATTIATTVATTNGIAASELTMTYLDATGASTSTPSLVQYVKADTAKTFPTLFLPVIGINSASITNHAKVQLKPTYDNCVICTLANAGNSFAQTGATVYAAGGPIIVDSAGPGAISINGAGGVTDTNSGGTAAIKVALGGTWTNSGGGAYNPTPTNIVAVPDPLAAVTQPPTSHSPTTVQPDAIITNNGNSNTLSPGIYDKIEYSGGGKLVLNPGTYIIKTDFIFNSGGRIDASAGVTIYLACASYPTPCSAGGQAGATLTVAQGGRFDLTGEQAGAEFPGMAIMADRNNTSTLALGPSSNTTITGTIYAPVSTANFTSGGYTLNSQIVVSKANWNLSSSVTVTYLSTQNYQPSNTLVLQV